MKSLALRGLFLAAVHLLAGVPLATAAPPNEFYIYQGQDTLSSTGASLYYFFDSHPDCDEANGAETWIEEGREDVSENEGVVCDGLGCTNGKYSEIERLEFNIHWGHYTIYKDRQHKMYDLDDKWVGSCLATDTLDGTGMQDSFECASPFPVSGVAIFWCSMLGPDPQPDPDPEPDPDPVPEPVPVKPILRIQPLGDSITKGSGSSDDNGYRGPLRDMIVSDITDEVDMVGSLAHGTMPDSSHEGHSGHMLASIRDYAESSLGASPNVVLLHAGTNNMDLEVDVEAAPRIIQQIIDKVHDRLPDTVVIVAKIIWANDARMQANTDAYNTKIEALVADNQDVGRPVLLADMSNILTTADLNDKKHPNNSGYRKMAMVWLDAIKDGIERGWITEPKTPTETQGVGLGVGHGSGAVYNCEGGNWEKHERFFDGFQTWEERGEIIPAKLNGHRDKVILADLNGDGRADYVLADNDGSVRAWINNGLGLPFTEYGNINPAWESVTGNMIRMADVDNDGLADLIILYSDGAAKVWKNTDGGRTFQALDAKWATGLESREKVHFQDVDGDGYADYVIVYSGGAVKWARNNHNNGQDSSRGNWEAAVTIAPGPQGVPQDRTRLYDLDGDGKTDYLVIYEGGAVMASRNTGNLNRDGAKNNFESLGTIVPGVNGVTGDMIRFADLDGDGRADFLAVAADGSVRAWRNLGIVGDKAASLRFADLDGDNRADIVSVDPATGAARAWLNLGGGAWRDIGEIAPGPSDDASTSRFEFADINGDGLADYIRIYQGGAVKAYLNNGNIPDQGKGLNWQDAITISPGIEGVPGSKVHFADLNGDGKADFLVIWDGGAVTAYLNTGRLPSGIWQSGYSVAPGVGEAGSKVRFADITGDGRAEYLISYDGGSVKSYKNNGNIPDVGKGPNWLAMGVIAGGVSPQGVVRLADLNGDGKADYLTLFEDGHVNAYINTCSWNAS